MKRMFDFWVALAALVVAFPLILCVALMVAVKLGRPVIFSQHRPGKDARIFHMYKFRSMTDERNSNGELLPDAQRLTTFGRLLRSTSLDELPGLWNVVKGDMSLVGPRPLLVEYIPLYSAEQARRHEVRPGITGWAQVNGRNAISWQQKFEYDLWYVNNQSLWVDLKIILLTVRRVWARADISQHNQATMEKFNGNN